MVSQRETTDRALSFLSPPSISARTSTSRRHRHNRSHHGSSTYLPQNDFPVFTHTGDIEIIVSTSGREQRYLLHRLILSQCSGFFEAGTSEEWSRAQGQAVGSSLGLSSIGENQGAESEVGRSNSLGSTVGGKNRWRYELDSGNQNEEIPMLVQKNLSATMFGGTYTPRPPPIRNKPPASQSGFFRSMANLSAMHIPHSQSTYDPANDLLRDYDNLFRIFYNYPPTLDAINIANAYVECKSLLVLADMYDALEVVGPRVDHHLLQFQGRLWKQIAKYPPSYLRLGYLARSKVIFQEATVHVVGQWPSGANLLRNQLPESVIEVIEDKVEELEEAKEKVEGKLFRLTLTTARGERVTPSNSYLDWMAVSLFRQWLAENTTPPPTPYHKDSPRNSDPRTPAPLPPPPPPLNTGRIYRLLGTGGPSYLAHDELKRFLKLRPDDYNRDNLRKFERRMEELKSLAREIVKPLMRNCLELDLGPEGRGLGYLTCTKIDDREFPWDQ
ncbi:MAG: hypothetical protein M1827_005290 [Pycnora praestabilis]|nr:MAG: hypothetical protein M1827_005290 [Pycnora praestabilis]